MRAEWKQASWPLALLLSAMLAPDPSARAQETDEDEQVAKYQPYRDYGTDWRLSSLFGFTPEDGILVGTGAIVYKFAFRTFPYLYRMELVGGITLSTGRWKFVYTAKFPSLSTNASLDIRAYASELEVRNFYGFGNNTPRDRQLEKNDFYRVASRQYYLEPLLRWKFGETVTLGLGASIKHFEARQEANRFLSSALLDTLGDDRWVVGTGVNVEIRTGEAGVAPRQGFFAVLSAWNYPYPFDRRRPFQRYTADLRGYSSLGPVTLALHGAGEKLEGQFPFYEAAFLGGATSLRGYNLNRFSGDASLSGSAELRLSLFKLKLLLPTQVGVFVFGDAGKVFLDGKAPSGWHADAGGGISLAPISQELTFSIAFASSPEGLFVNGVFGFSF